MGALGGAVVHRELADTVNSLPDGLCQGGTNNNEPCTVIGDCPDGTGVCETAYLGGLTKATLSGLLGLVLPRDIDADGEKTCEGAGNDGSVCSVDADCPTLAGCDDNEATSIGLSFTAIDAAITGTN